MVSQQEVHESVQILLFVCLPLLLLLIAFIVISVRASRTVAKFPTFTVRVERLGREGGYIYYRDAEKKLEFSFGELASWRFLIWPIKRIVVLSAPRNLTTAEILQITPNLLFGLAKLGFHQYKIYKQGEKVALSGGETRNQQQKAP